MEASYDVAVVGGGPAGCAAAITAARAGFCVILFERGQYPRHKVCGEFISPEAHETLKELLGNIDLLTAPAAITRARMFSDGHQIEFPLELPAWSITRHDLDHALWRAAQNAGVECRENEPVEQAARNSLVIGRKVVAAKAVINASGRWSNLRQPTVLPTPRWIGLKAHFSGEFAPHSTDIYFFRGGYCGVQPISADRINASAMVRSDVATSLEEVFASHPDLWLRSRQWEQLFGTLSTAPLIHNKPKPVNEGVLNAGDAAGFIDPFVGDGISMALRSGVLAASCAPDASRYEHEYHRRFDNAFQSAAFARRLVRAPEAVRRIAIFSFQSAMLRKWALKRTRGS